MAERPEDLNLPPSVVNRIVRDALPQSAKVSREANIAITKAASVFVLYATSCANNVALKAHRKTMHGQDVIQAMQDMEFNKFVSPLELALDGWKMAQAKKRESKAQEAKNKKRKDQEKDNSNSQNTDDDDDADGDIQVIGVKNNEENKENSKSVEENDSEMHETT